MFLDESLDFLVRSESKYVPNKREPAKCFCMIEKLLTVVVAEMSEVSKEPPVFCLVEVTFHSLKVLVVSVQQSLCYMMFIRFVVV